MHWTEVGFVKKPHGIKGECLVVLKAGRCDWDFKILKTASLQKKNQEQIELKVSHIRSHHKGLIILFEDFQTPQQVEETLKGSSFSIPQSLLISKQGEKIFLIEILKFQVFDKGVFIGDIIDFSSNGPQDLLIIQTESGEFQVPLIDEFLEKIDYQEKKVFMNLPEGLNSI